MNSACSQLAFSVTCRQTMPCNNEGHLPGLDPLVEQGQSMAQTARELERDVRRLRLILERILGVEITPACAGHPVCTASAHSHGHHHASSV